jgi:hypothetical protein
MESIPKPTILLSVPLPRGDYETADYCGGLVVVVVVTLAGQTVQPTKPVLGAGSTLCSTWTGADKIVRNADGGTTVTGSPKDPVQVSWILGYLSAVGVTGKAAQPGGESYVIGWVSGACMSQPSRTLAAVVAEFVTSGR